MLETALARLKSMNVGPMLALCTFITMTMITPSAMRESISIHSFKDVDM